jgi:hypothetical protein
VVSVILINEAFEYVAKGPFLILKTFAWKLCSLPYFTLVVDIVVLESDHPRGKGCYWGVSLMSHRIAPTHTFHFPCFFPFVSSSFGFSGHIDPRRACTSFHGKKGLKAQRLVAGKR